MSIINDKKSEEEAGEKEWRMGSGRRGIGEEEEEKGSAILLYWVFGTQN